MPSKPLPGAVVPVAMSTSFRVFSRECEVKNALPAGAEPCSRQTRATLFYTPFCWSFPTTGGTGTIGHARRKRSTRDLADVSAFHDAPGCAALRDRNHRLAELLCSRHGSRCYCLQEWNQRTEDCIEQVVNLRSGANPVEGLDESGAEHVGGFKRHRHESVFG